MAEKKWWEKTTKEWVNDTLKPAVSSLVSSAKNNVNTVKNTVNKTTQGQAAGNATNYSNLASGNHSWGTSSAGKATNANNMGLAPLYTSADRYSPEKIAASKQNTGSSGGGGTVSGYYSGGGGYSGYAPYVSPYEAQLQEAVNRLMNREPFSYDYMSDPLYQQYAKSYGIQGELARQDTLGDVSSMTGGLPSSYAVTAAQQAQNSWNSALNDMIPALQDAAYQRWMGNYEADTNLANMLTSLDSMAYDRYNTDRNYDLALQEANNRVRQTAVVNDYSMPSGMSYEEMLEWGANNLGSMTSAQRDTFMDNIEYQTRLQELMYGGSGLLG